jgi:flagellar hook protein FlgE
VELSQFDQSILAVRQHLNFFLPGPIEETTNYTDLAILGNGFFTVRDPVQNVFYATRYGAFQLDSASRLVDRNGYRVQGITDPVFGTVGDLVLTTNGAQAFTNLTVAGDPTLISLNGAQTLTNLTVMGDPIQISLNGAQTLTNFNLAGLGFEIDFSGTIYLNLSDGTSVIPGQILLQNYQNLQALVPVPGQLYSNLPAALPTFDHGIPGTLGLGTLRCGSLEPPTTAQALQLPPPAGLRLLVSGLINTATVETSTNLISWSVAGPVTGSVMEDAEFFDTNSTASPAKFYRVR